MNERVARAVREGLAGPVKSLPAWLLHDGDGARLLARLSLQPTWYPARAERFLLETRADALLEAAGLVGVVPGRLKGVSKRVEVIELGPCAASRSGALLAALAQRWEQVRYVPVDGSESVAVRLLKLASELPDVEIRPRHLGGAAGGLACLGIDAEPRLVLLLGGMLGRMATVEAQALLAEVRTCVGPHGALIVGVDHNRDRESLRAAYADPEGVVAALNRNVLQRVNRELGAEFDLGAARHVVRWCPTLGRVELALVTTRPQDVPVDALGVRVHLDAGEAIRTAWCRQMAVPRLDAMLAQAALARVGSWFDPTGRYAVHVARPR